MITSRSPSPACLYHLTQYHPHKPNHSSHEALSRITSLLTHPQSRKKLASLNLFSSPEERQQPPSPNQNKTKKHTKTSTEGILCPLIYLSIRPPISLYCLSLSLSANTKRTQLLPHEPKPPNSLCNKTSYKTLKSNPQTHLQAGTSDLEQRSNALNNTRKQPDQARRKN